MALNTLTSATAPTEKLETALRAPNANPVGIIADLMMEYALAADQASILATYNAAAASPAIGRNKTAEALREATKNLLEYSSVKAAVCLVEWLRSVSNEMYGFISSHVVNHYRTNRYPSFDQELRNRNALKDKASFYAPPPGNPAEELAALKQTGAIVADYWKRVNVNKAPLSLILTLQQATCDIASKHKDARVLAAWLIHVRREIPDMTAMLTETEEILKKSLAGDKRLAAEYIGTLMEMGLTSQARSCLYMYANTHFPDTHKVFINTVRTGTREEIANALLHPSAS